MKKIISLILLVTYLGITTNTFATIQTSNTLAGPWNAIASWLTAVPTCSDDTIHIRVGDVISIVTPQDYEACATAKLIIIDGTLLFPTNGPKLKLPSGACLFINPGGLISAPGNDNSNKISIAGNWVWESKDPDVVGPGLLCASPLPIELINLKAIINNGRVDIYWTTTTEINNAFFTIEKSTDAKEWEKIIDIEGSGNSTGLIDYEASDDNPWEGTSYYRLKQTDYDGAYTYSTIVSVEYFNFDDNERPDIRLSPNPFTANLTILLDNIEEPSVIITGFTGTCVASQIIDNETYIWNSESLPEGIYFIFILEKLTLIEVKKVIKVN
ncbi:MAG: T9SS type A sorting domain-containing protein [Flavobacteriales bacterium]|nr:T9SS type A sorting domain-containing protein [Flavobacteriales bacterium]